MDERLGGDIQIRNKYKWIVILWIAAFIPLSGASVGLDKVSCPSMCVCEGAWDTGINVDCTGKNLTNVPQDLDTNTIRL